MSFWFSVFFFEKRIYCMYKEINSKGGGREGERDMCSTTLLLIKFSLCTWWTVLTYVLVHGYTMCVLPRRHTMNLISITFLDWLLYVCHFPT